MATSTPNLHLKKPDRLEYVSVVTDINDNMDRIDTAYGATKSNFGDAYDPSSTYAAGDICIYNNVLYQANTAISTPEAWNASHWDARSVADLIGTLNSNITVKIVEYGNSNITSNTGNVLQSTIVRFVYTSKWVFIFFKIRLENPNGRPTVTVPVPTDLQGATFSGNGAVTQMRIGTTNYITDVSGFSHPANSNTMTIAMENFLGDVPSGNGWLVLQGANMNKL